MSACACRTVRDRSGAVATDAFVPVRCSAATPPKRDLDLSRQKPEQRDAAQAQAPCAQCVCVHAAGVSRRGDVTRLSAERARQMEIAGAAPRPACTPCPLACPLTRPRLPQGQVSAELGCVSTRLARVIARVCRTPALDGGGRGHSEKSGLHHVGAFSLNKPAVMRVAEETVLRRGSGRLRCQGAGTAEAHNAIVNKNEK